MRAVTFLFASLFAIFAFAERELTLGKYADETRARVVAKIREALDGKGALEGPVTNMLPSSFMQLHPDCGMFLDPASAALLKE